MVIIYNNCIFMKNILKAAYLGLIMASVMFLTGCDKIKVMIEDRIALKDIQNTCWEMQVPKDMFPMVDSGTLYVKITSHDAWIFNDKGFQAFYGIGTLMNQVAFEANGKTSYMDATLSSDKKTLKLKYTAQQQRESWEGIMSGNALSQDLPDARNLADIELTLNKIAYSDMIGYWLLTDKPVNSLDKNAIIWGTVECFMPDGRQISFYRNRPGQLVQTKEVFDAAEASSISARSMTIGQIIYEPWVSRTFTKDMANLLNWWTWKNTENGKIAHFTVPKLGSTQYVKAKWQTYSASNQYESETEFKFTGSTILIKEDGEEVSYKLSYSNGILTMESFKGTKTFTTYGNRTTEKVEKED